MNRSFFKLGAAAAILALAGCAETLDEQLGASSSSFGASVNNNVVAQSVSLGGGALADLQARFRASATDRINFAFNSAELDSTARSILAQQADFIRGNPAIKFRVYGHTDLVGSNSYNRSLGLRRARAAVNYLVAQGVSRSKLEAVSSLGETQPLVRTQNPERLNRRTVTQVMGFSGGQGSDFDGKRAVTVYNSYLGTTTSEITATPGGGG